MTPMELAGTIAGGPIVQICWQVDDIATSVDRWVRTTGAGPFFLAGHIAFDELTYRGRPATLDQSSAIGQWGGLQVELFHQHCGSPSGAVETASADGSPSLQHVTWFAPDVAAEGRRLAALGFDEVMTARLPAMSGMRIAWYDARPLLGCMVEVYEEHPTMRRLYRKVAAAAEGWDGRDPLRPLG